MRNTCPWALTALATVMVSSSPCLAAEQGVIKARLALNDVAARVRVLKKGDQRNANYLIKKINYAVKALNGCKDKKAKEWQEQAKRARDLDAKVRARLGNVAPKPTGSVKPDEATKRAKQHVDRAQKLLAKLGPGDVATANKVIAACNDARRQLGVTNRRSTAMWKETRARADEISKKARALASKKRPAKPVPKRPAKPTSKGPAKPAEPAVPETVPSLPREEPKESRVYYEKHNQNAESIRNEVTKKLVPEIEKLAAAGKMDEAKLKFWGVWAQVKRARLWSGGGKKGEQPFLDLYQRAREAIYGSSPVLGVKDGPVELLSLIKGADAALGAGDLESARTVLTHVEWRVRGGVAKEGKLAEASDKLLARYKQRNQEFAKALLPKLNALAAAVPLEGGCTFEEQVFSLRAYQLKGIKTWLLKFPARLKALEGPAKAFVAAAPDPEYVDRAFVRITKTKQGAQTYKELTGALRMLIYGQAVIDAGGHVKSEIKSLVRYAKARLESGKERLQKGWKAEVDLAAAKVTLKEIEQLGGSEDDLAAVRAKIEQVQASGGANKLQEAEKKIHAAFKLAKVGKAYELKKAGYALESAKSFIAAAKKDGVDTTGAEVKVKSAYVVLGRHWGKLAEAELKRAEAKLDDGAAMLKDGARAWAVPNRLSSAIYIQKNCLKDIVPRTGAKQAGLKQRAAAIVKRAERMKGQVVGAQRLPADAYEGSSGSSWRSRFKRMIKRDRGWTVLKLTIAKKDWKKKSSTTSYRSGSNTKTSVTRYYKHLLVWAAIPNADDPERIDLRYLGFRLHKMVDGSYRQLKIYYVDNPVPMLRQNLEK